MQLGRHFHSLILELPLENTVEIKAPSVMITATVDEDAVVRRFPIDTASCDVQPTASVESEKPQTMQVATRQAEAMASSGRQSRVETLLAQRTKEWNGAPPAQAFVQRSHGVPLSAREHQQLQKFKRDLMCSRLGYRPTHLDIIVASRRMLELQWLIDDWLRGLARFSTVFSWGDLVSSVVFAAAMVGVCRCG